MVARDDGGGRSDSAAKGGDAEELTCDSWLDCRQCNRCGDASAGRGRAGNGCRAGCSGVDGDDGRFRIGAEYDNEYASHAGPLGDTVPRLRVDAHVRADELGGFASWTVSPTPRLASTLGLRADHFSYNGATHVTPRASVTYRLDRATALTGQAGLYRQSLPMVLLAQAAAHGDLRDPLAVH